MNLIIGGYGQGKLAYARQKYGEEAKLFPRFHIWVREKLLACECPEKEIRAYLKEHPDTIIVCDEVGNGIVPMEAFEREYRERLGRILTELAAEAEEVERVICGLGQKIK